MVYVRDATDRIIARTEATTTTRYDFAGPGDAAVATADAAGVVAERTMGLIGGVTVTKRAAGDVWSYPNVHGDVMAVADAAGAKQGPTRSYDPFGQALGALPDNSAGNFDYGWLGQHQRGTEHAPGIATIEMGTRQYVPSLGRFLEVDPVAGGSANDYDYVYGDPVNGFDLDGTHCRPWHPHHCIKQAVEAIKDFANGNDSEPSREDLQKIQAGAAPAVQPSNTNPISRVATGAGDFLKTNVSGDVSSAARGVESASRRIGLTKVLDCAVNGGSAVSSVGDLVIIGQVFATANSVPGPGTIAALAVATGYSLYSAYTAGSYFIRNRL